MVANTPDGDHVSAETLEDVVHELLQYQAAQFDNICEHCGGDGCEECEGTGEAGDLDVSGADLVDVFSAIRPRLRAALSVAATVSQQCPNVDGARADRGHGSQSIPRRFPGSCGP